MNMEPRPANAEEIEHMVRLAEEAFEQGAFAFTTGLEYPPGKDSGLDELAALLKVAAKYDGIHASHVRNRDVYFSRSISKIKNGFRSRRGSVDVPACRPQEWVLPVEV